MKRFVFLIVSICMVAMLFAQSNAKIKELESKRKALREDIARSESLLGSTKKDVNSQLSTLALLTNQIAERRKYIEAVEKDVIVLNREIGSLELQIKDLETQLNQKRERYQTSLQYLRKNRTIEEKLLFIFSAKTLKQTYRRMRYVQEYASYQRRQGEEIIRKQEQIKDKQAELQQVHSEKTNLLQNGQQEKVKLEVQEKERRNILTNLQKKQKNLQDEIKKKRREADKLNAQIDKLIQEEIAKSNKKAKKESGKTSSSTGKGTSKATPVDKFTLSKADLQLSGSFEKNRGRLPMPITGPYMIVGRYGQYNVEGLRNVRLDNKGIDIQGKEGAKARAVFDGEVSAIFQFDGQIGVLVRHGNYISVYCNLSNVTVKKGDKVKAKDAIGDITANSGRPILHFQLRKETTKLNPEPWLNK